MPRVLGAGTLVALAGALVACGGDGTDSSERGDADQGPRYIYWTTDDPCPDDPERFCIARAAIDGTAINLSFIPMRDDEGISRLDGRPLHPSSDANPDTDSSEVVVGRSHLFHTDGATDGTHLFTPSNDTIERYRLDHLVASPSRSRTPDVTIHLGGGQLSVVAVAADAGYMYWARQDDRIGRARIDGTDVEPDFIRASDVGRGVAVSDGYLYWTRDGEEGGWAIGRARVDGSDVRENFFDPDTIDSELGDGDPGPIAVDEDYLYIGGHEEDDGSHTIIRIRTDGSDVQPRFISGLTGPTTSLGVTPP